MLAEAAPEVIRGAKSISFNNHVIYVVQGEPYVSHRPALVETVAAVKAQVFSQPLDLTAEYVEKDLIPQYDLNTPPRDRLEATERRGVVLLAATDEDPLVFVGVATARQVAIRTSERFVDLLWMTRAIKEGHRKAGLGKFFAQAILTYNHEVSMVGLRTQSPAGVWSAVESGIFEEGEMHPFEGSYRASPLAQEVMMQLFYRFRRHATQPPNPDSGVAKNDYKGENTAYIPDLTHAPTMSLLRRMEDEYRMNFKKGDAMYVVGQAA